jgi:hypothetical protein
VGLGGLAVFVVLVVEERRTLGAAHDLRLGPGLAGQGVPVGLQPEVPAEQGHELAHGAARHQAVDVVVAQPLGGLAGDGRDLQRLAPAVVPGHAADDAHGAVPVRRPAAGLGLERRRLRILAAAGQLAVQQHGQAHRAGHPAEGQGDVALDRLGPGPLGLGHQRLDHLHPRLGQPVEPRDLPIERRARRLPGRDVERGRDGGAGVHPGTYHEH